MFSHIWTEYGEIRSIYLYSVRMRENTDQKISEYAVSVVHRLKERKLMALWTPFLFALIIINIVTWITCLNHHILIFILFNFSIGCSFLYLWTIFTLTFNLFRQPYWILLFLQISAIAAATVMKFRLVIAQHVKQLRDLFFPRNNTMFYSETAPPICYKRTNISKKIH